ncbi:MAG: hypothetical protein ABGX16_06050 [Pirellulales bacterium]
MWTTAFFDWLVLCADVAQIAPYPWANIARCQPAIDLGRWLAQIGDDKKDRHSKFGHYLGWLVDHTFAGKTAGINWSK